MQPDCLRLRSKKVPLCHILLSQILQYNNQIAEQGKRQNRWQVTGEDSGQGKEQMICQFSR